MIGMFPELEETNTLLEGYPYSAFDNPAENIAERLIILAHLTYNAEVWGKTPERRKRYWKAFLENVEGGANTNRLSVWWKQFRDGMASRPLNNPDYLHEKNLLLDPTHLSTEVEDREVLDILREQAPYLVDRARFWVRTRSKKNQEDTVPDANFQLTGEDD